MSAHLDLEWGDSILVELRAKPVFIQRIYELQKCDNELEVKWKLIENEQTSEFNIRDNESLYSVVDCVCKKI